MTFFIFLYESIKSFSKNNFMQIHTEFVYNVNRKFSKLDIYLYTNYNGLFDQNT
jgi:hypothetical protein